MLKRNAIVSILTFILLSSSAVWAVDNDQIKMLASDGGWLDHFGQSVALDGDVAVVGATRFGDDESAYVFRFNGANWVEDAILTPPDGVTEECFGYSVALDGEVAAVAAAGAVYMFRYQDPNWVREAKLEVPGIGHPAVLMKLDLLAVQGDVAVAGALLDFDFGNRAGAAHVFRYNGGSWHEEAKLFADDPEAEQLFGCSVALDGELILVGADEARSHGPGAVYVFQYQDPNWVRQAKLTAPDGQVGNHFGQSVALKGNKALVGAPYNDVAGSAYVFEYEQPNWLFEAKLTASDPIWRDGLGTSVALADDMALVGAPILFFGTVPAGAVYVFRFDGVNWYQNGKGYAFDRYGGDRFGYSLALSGDRTLVGARFNSELGKHAGAAYIFDASCLYNLTGDFNNDCRVNLQDYASLGSQWLINCRHQPLNTDCFHKPVVFEENKLQPHNLNTIDSYFGCSIAIFNNNAIIGAFFDNDYIGSAYIYQYNQGQWIEKQKLTPSVVAHGNYFGISVDIGDNIILIGNPGPGGWAQSPGRPNDRFGIYLSLSGSKLD